MAASQRTYKHIKLHKTLTKKNPLHPSACNWTQNAVISWVISWMQNLADLHVLNIQEWSRNPSSAQHELDRKRPVLPCLLCHRGSQVQQNKFKSFSLTPLRLLLKCFSFLSSLVTAISEALFLFSPLVAPSQDSLLAHAQPGTSLLGCCALRSRRKPWMKGYWSAAPTGNALVSCRPLVTFSSNPQYRT